MEITASQLRQDVYNLLDEVILSGDPLVINRKGRTLKVVPELKVDKFKKLKKHDVLTGDPEDIVHLDWSDEWKEEI